jgi:hypothetical protein
VIFSSHLLDEVERMCDHVTVVHEGRAVLQGPVDEIRAMHRVSQVRFPRRLDVTPAIDGALSIAGDGRSWSVVHASPLESLRDVVAHTSGEVTESRVATLEEILVARAVAAYAVGMLVGVTRERMDGAVLGAHFWALAIAIPIGTLLVFTRVLAGRVLTSRQVAAVSIGWLLFAALYLDMLRANGLMEASPAVEALAVASTLLPLLAAGLAPWSLSLIRHA